MKEIGSLYIQFAATEKNLFRFLFQSNEFSGKTIYELINAKELQPIITIRKPQITAKDENLKTRSHLFIRNSPMR